MLDISSWLEFLLLTVTAKTVSNLFLWIIVAVFVLSIYESSKLKHSGFLSYAPTLMTSLGILGTFTGIVIGLLHFDTADAAAIDRSIPLMLAGLKTAFITSLIGMSGAIAFKSADAWVYSRRRKQAELKETVTPEDIHEQLVRSNLQLVSLQQSLAGSEEGSLVGQIKLARSELNDSARKSAAERQEFASRLWSEMQNFSDLLAKSATEAVIEALRQVIVDFNKNLTEQFGDNFKRLDESVQKLVIWQAQYIEQLTQMAEQYGEGVKAIDHTREAVERIGESTASIPPSLESLQAVIQTNQHQIQELQRHLDVFIQMRDKATEAVPQIKAYLEKVGEQMEEAARTLSQTMAEGATEFKDSVEQTNVSMRKLADNVQNEAEAVSEVLSDTVKDVRSGVTDMLHRLEDGAKSLQTSLDTAVGQITRNVEQQIQRTMNTLNSEVTGITNKTGEQINAQLRAMHEARDRELNNVMREMGSALATITGRFTEDYSKLVQAMSQVVNSQVQRNR